MASSSSSAQERSIPSPKLYDAFISHRVPDVKDTLAKQLYDLLTERGCRAFLDREETHVGEAVFSAIHNAICSSRVQIAIFSQGYARSPWCLNELVLMLEQTDSLFIPVYYDVKPWEIRDIENKNSANSAAFYFHKTRGRYLDKLDQWKEALVYASHFSGYEYSLYKENLCEMIVSRVLQEMKNMNPLFVARYPVGLSELVQDFERSCLETARGGNKIIGIYGLAGSGKTTLAKELFNRMHLGYDAACFISDVRESDARRELHCLQIQLLQDLFPEYKENRDLNIQSVDHGVEELKYRLVRARHLRFLIILDDIDHEDQLDALLPNSVMMMRSGILVIITTRDKRVLRGADICFKMEGLNRDHAKALFCSHAFRGGDPPCTYVRLVESFVNYCGGLPLLLEVLGAQVYRRDERYWRSKLVKIKIFQPREIMRRLEISFDGLNAEEKHIFLDIACFFNDKSKDMAMEIWMASQWATAEVSVQTLIYKCLVEVDHRLKGDVFIMNDHLRNLGRELADGLNPPRLWQPHLLKSMQKKGFQEIIEKTSGRCYNYVWDSSLNSRIEYFIGNINKDGGTSSSILWIGVDQALWGTIGSWTRERQLQYLRLTNLPSGQIAIQERKSSSAESELCDERIKNREALDEVASNEVGLDEFVEDFEDYCQQMSKGLKNNIVCIYGVGGSGKTTLAKHIFSRKRVLYGKSSFLFDVREASAKDDLTSLQNKLLNDLLSGNQPKFSSTKEGIIYIESVLERGPNFSFLLVIDDVDHISQVDALLPKYTPTSNSLVIITTRDESVMKDARIHVRYNIKGMDQQHGRQLFCWNAFRRPYPQTEYKELVECFVEKCRGLPLSLRVLGGNVFGQQKEYWESELDKVKGLTLSGDIKDVLKISYGSLEDEEKEIFMDVACFFTEKDQSIGIRIWNASSSKAEGALQKLRDKRLVGVVKEECWNEISNEASPVFVFRMDNHLRHLGREMANNRPNKRDWRPKDLKPLEPKSFSEILRKDYEEGYRCFNSIRNKSITYFIENSGSSTTLRWLQLDGKDCIPSGLPLQGLEGLRIRGRLPQRLWHQSQAPSQLKELVCEFTNCHYMEKAMLRRNWDEFLKLLVMLELLESLVLQIESQGNRKDIVIEWNYFQKFISELKCLKTLGLSGLYINGEIAISREIAVSPSRMSTDLWLSLEAITLSHVRRTSKVSISCRSLKFLKLKYMEDLTEVDLIGVDTLKCLELIQCHKLEKLLANNLTQLEMLSIEKCWELKELPNLSHSNSLRRMRITRCEELHTITGIQELSWGESITITCCPELQNVPGLKYLEGLQYMILSGGRILSFISELQELPSEFTIVMGKAAASFPKVDELASLGDALYEFQEFSSESTVLTGRAETVLPKDEEIQELSSQSTVLTGEAVKSFPKAEEMTGRADAFIKFHSREEAYDRVQLLSKKTLQSLSAIILFALVDGDDNGSKYMVEGSPGQTIDLSWAGGKWIYTIVVTGRKQISNARYFNWMPTSCTIEKGFVLAVKEGRQMETLSILKRITERYCKTDAIDSSDEAE